MNTRHLFLSILVVMLALPAFADKGSTIHGTVLDSTNVSLPGATVILEYAGESTPLVAYSGLDGAFYFENLSQGSYELHAEMDGFQAVTATIEVKEQENQPVHLVLPPIENIQEAVTVVAENTDKLNKDEPESKEELDEVVFDRAPVASSRFQDTLPLIPSVVRGPDGLMNMNGARASESALLVNGSNVTDPVTGNFAIELPIEAVENVEVLTNPYSAEYGKFSGGVTSVSTRAGDDHFKVEFNDFFPRFHFDNGLNGVESFTPRFRVSGPVVNNLFFSQAIQYTLNRTYLDDLPKDANRIELEGVDSITQVDYRPSDTHQMTFTFSLFPQETKNAKLNTFLPEESTPDFKQSGYNLALFDRRFFDNGSFLENTISRKTYDVTVEPKGDQADPFEFTTEGNRNGYFNYQDRNSSRVQWSSSYTFRPITSYGGHTLRAGLDVAHTAYSADVSYSSVEVLGTKGLVEKVDFSGSAHVGHSSNEATSYIQDHWTPLMHLAVDLGVRMDYSSVSGNANFEPRIALVYSPAPMPNTVFRTGFGTFYDKIFLNTADFEDYPSRTITNYDADGNIVATRQISNFLADKIKTPRSVAWNFQVDHEIASKLLLRSNISIRHADSQFIVVPSGDRLLLENEGRNRYWDWELTGKYQISSESNLYASYIRSSTTGNYNDFDSYYGNFQQALIRDDAYAPMAFDSPNRFLLWGVVKVPGKVYFSPLLEVRDGFRYSEINQAQQFVGERNSLRFPLFHELDVRVTRSFTVLRKYELTAGVKVFNILNHFNPRDIQNNIDSPAFGTFYNGVGRTFRAAFEIKY